MTEIIEDRLEWLMRHFSLRARAFQAGGLDQCALFEPQTRLGYIHLLQSGCVHVSNNHQPAVEIAEPGIFFFMNPTHTLVEPQGDDVSIVCASFEFSLGAGNPLQEALPDMCYLRSSEAPGIDNTMQQLAFEASEKHCGRQTILNHLCEVALVLVLRELMDQQKLNIGLLAGLADLKLHKALNAIHADAARNWSLEGLAEVSGMSRARFAARFRSVAGMTPAAYLAEWRIGLAQSMLETGKDLKIIAEEVGYGSASALSRAFAKRRGLSPSAWLKSLQ